MTKNSIYLTLLCIIGFTGPFWHVAYGIRDTEGLFGYKYMSSFLDAIGTKILILSIGLLLLFASKQIINEYKKPIKYIAFIVIYIACFFITHIFISKKVLVNAFGIRDYPTFFYYLSMIIISILSGFIIRLFNNAFITSEEKFKKIVINLVSLLGDLKVNHYYKMTAKASENTNSDAITKDTEHLEQKITNVLKTIDDTISG